MGMGSKLGEHAVLIGERRIGSRMKRITDEKDDTDAC